MRQNVSWPDAAELRTMKEAAKRWAKRVGVPAGIAVSAYVREACRRMMEQEETAKPERGE